MEKYYADFLKGKGYSDDYITNYGVKMLTEQHQKYIDAGYSTSTAMTMTEFWFFLFPMKADEVSELLYIMGSHYKVAHNHEFGKKAIQDLKEYYEDDNPRVTGEKYYEPKIGDTVYCSYTNEYVTVEGEWGWDSSKSVRVRGKDWCQGIPKMYLHEVKTIDTYNKSIEISNDTIKLANRKRIR